MQLQFNTTPGPSLALAQAALELMSVLSSDAFAEEIRGRVVFRDPLLSRPPRRVRGRPIPSPSPLPLHLMQHERRGRRSGFVYVARDFSGLVKIGITSNPEQRFMDALAWNPTLQFLVIWASVDPYGVETALHIAHRDQYHEREWFRLSEHELGALIGG